MFTCFKYLLLFSILLVGNSYLALAADDPCLSKPTQVNLGSSIPFLELIAKMSDPFVDNCISEKVDLKLTSTPSALELMARIKEEREIRIAKKEFCAAASLSMQLAQIDPRSFVSIGGVDSIEALIEQARKNPKAAPVELVSILSFTSSKLRFLRNWLTQTPDDKSECMGLNPSVPECNDGPSATRALAAYRRYFPKAETGEFMSVEGYRMQTLRDWARQIPRETGTCLRPNLTASPYDCDEGQNAVKALRDFRLLYPKSAAQSEFLALETKLLDYRSAHEQRKLNIFAEQFEVAVHPAAGKEQAISKMRGDTGRIDGMVNTNCVGPTMSSSGAVVSPGKCDLVHKTTLAVRVINQSRDMLTWSRPSDASKVRAVAIKYLAELELTLKEHPEWSVNVGDEFKTEEGRAVILKSLTP